MIEKIFSNFADEKLVEKAYNIAIAHREKRDGNGYPKGLSGECGNISDINFLRNLRYIPLRGYDMPSARYVPSGHIYKTE